MIRHLCTCLGLAATLWVADRAGAQPTAAPRERAGLTAQEVQRATADTMDDDDSAGGDGVEFELRVSALGGTFEGPLLGAEASAALFNAPERNRSVQLGLEAQVRHAVDSDPEGTLEDAALTAVTGNVVIRVAHGNVRPYGGVGAGAE